MNVLIVESDPDLGRLWQEHMQRQDMVAELVNDEASAIEALRARAFDAIVLNLALADGSPLAIADYAGYRHPDTQIVFVTSSSFFSDGSIFSLSANARAYVQADTPPEDLTAMVAHFGRDAQQAV